MSKPVKRRGKHADLPPYGDLPGIIQWLAEFAMLSIPAQKDDYNRARASLVVKRLAHAKPKEREFRLAMSGIVLTPEIFYSLTLHQPNKYRIHDYQPRRGKA